MPIKAYNEGFDQTLEKEVIEKSVTRTSQIATDFLMKQFNKTMVSQGTQSPTCDDIFHSYVAQVHYWQGVSERMKGNMFTKNSEIQRMSVKIMRLGEDRLRIKDLYQTQLDKLNEMTFESK